MSVTKELIEKEKDLVEAGQVRDMHLHREGTFIRAYDWSAWLACKYLHDFKVNKRTFKGIDEPVAYIGFPETSLEKWIPEGAVQRLEDEKYLVITLPELMITDTYETMAAAYNEWKNADEDGYSGLFHAHRPPAASRHHLATVAADGHSQSGKGHGWALARLCGYGVCGVSHRSNSSPESY